MNSPDKIFVILPFHSSKNVENAFLSFSDLFQYFWKATMSSRIFCNSSHFCFLKSKQKSTSYLFTRKEKDVIGAFLEIFQIQNSRGKL